MLGSLLTGDEGPSVELLIQALKEMVHAHTRAELAYRFIWFYLMLRRTDTMSEQDKQAVKEAINTMFTYEEIIQDDPIIQNLLAQRTLVSKAEGKAEGRIENMKDVILSFLSIRFSPVLAAKAQPIVMAIRDYEALNRLYQQLIKVTDEQTVFLLLNLLDERPQHGPSDLPTES